MPTNGERENVLTAEPMHRARVASVRERNGLEFYAPCPQVVMGITVNGRPECGDAQARLGQPRP
jgi:CHAD domain-containing protein